MNSVSFNPVNRSIGSLVVYSLFFNLKTTFFRIFEWLQVIVRYYRRERRFMWVDLSLASQYLFRNPHRLSKAFLRKRGVANIYAFGETPLTTLDQIAKECGILSHDTLYELGCGSGRTCFWLSTFVKCRVIGVDYLPAFIQKAQRVKRWRRLAQIDFVQGDMLQIDLRKASFVYLYGICLEDAVIEQLVLHFSQLSPQAKVISVSYPLTEYGHGFKVEKSFTARFPWGKAEVFLNIKL